MNIFSFSAQELCCVCHPNVVHKNADVEILQLLFVHQLKVFSLISFAEVKLYYSSFYELAVYCWYLLDCFGTLVQFVNIPGYQHDIEPSVSKIFGSCKSNAIGATCYDCP